MLTVRGEPATRDATIDDLRGREFARLDESGIAYLDYTGSALHADRQLARYFAALRTGVLGNPHSESVPSRAATAVIDDARRRVLRFLDADPAQYVVIFTANCSAAIKLVAESYPFTRHTAVVLSADNHNSMNGMREFARRNGASVTQIPLDSELRLADPLRHLVPRGRGRQLFGFPAQSNFSGVQHSLALIEAAQEQGFDVLLDAASFVASNALSLTEHRPEFVVLSFYKLFGYPTGVGALVARRDALAGLRRPWFAGGTVEYASVQNTMHALREAPDGYEDGTPNFAALAALRHGFDFLEETGVARIHEHVLRLTRVLLDGLRGICHPDGAPSAIIYGPTDGWMRGCTVTFNLLDARHRVIPYPDVELRARDAGVAIRGGCFCNPGAAEHAFGFDAGRARACLENASAGGFSIQRFARCLGDDVAVGALRASAGLANTERDVDRLLGLVQAISNDESALRVG